MTGYILSNVLGVDLSELLIGGREFYKEVTIPSRRKGKSSRRIQVPADELKAVQRSLLQNVLGHVPPHRAATAFFKGRTIALNARQHHRCVYLYKTDISDFFGSITANMVRQALLTRFTHLNESAINEAVALATHKGVLPQGAPTSPHLATLVLYDFDERLTKLSGRLGACYTRYADDIAVSSPDPEALDLIADALRSYLFELGLKQHPAKTRRFGPEDRKIVTGLDVSSATIRPPRVYKAAALVRICEKFPKRAAKRILIASGYLSHWRAISPDDAELKALLRRMERLRTKGREQQRATSVETRSRVAAKCRSGCQPMD